MKICDKLALDQEDCDEPTIKIGKIVHGLGSYCAQISDLIFHIILAALATLN